MDLTNILSTPMPAADPNSQNPASGQTTNPQTTQVPEWVNSLPEAYRADQHVVSHANLESLLAEYGVLKKNAGQSSIPDFNEPYENHKDFFTKFGVPETFDKYEIGVPEGFPEGLKISDEFMNQARQLAHKHKIPASAFKEFANEFLGLEKAAFEGMQQQYQQELENRSNQLQQRWGAEVEQRTEWAQKAYNQFAQGDLVAELENSGIITHPAFLHLFSEIGKAMQLPASPGASSTGSSVQSQIAHTPDQIKSAIDAFRADPIKAKALTNPGDPNHKRFNAELDALYVKLYPDYVPGR